MKPRVGAVVRWDRAHNIDLDPPAWGVITGTRYGQSEWWDGYLFANIPKGFLRGVFACEYPYKHHRERKYEIIPDDQVPDHVWAALAVWRLTQ